MLNKLRILIQLNPEIIILGAIVVFTILKLYTVFKRRYRSYAKIEKIIGKFKTRSSLSSLKIDTEDPSKAYSINNELEQVIISLFNDLKIWKRKPYNYLEKKDGDLHLRYININKPLTFKLKDKICIGKDIFTNEFEEIDFNKNPSMAVVSPSGIGKTTLLKIIIAQANQLKIKCKIISSHNMDFPYKTLNPFVHEEKFKSIINDIVQRIERNERTDNTLLVLDEVQSWLPGQSKETKKAIEDIINQGRKFGVYIILASQTVALGKLSSKIGVDITSVSYLAVGGFPNDATISVLGIPSIKRIHQKDLRGLFYCGRSELKPIKIFSQVRKPGFGELIK